MEEYKNIEESITGLSNGTIVSKKQGFVFPLLLLAAGAAMLLVNTDGLGHGYEFVRYLFLLAGIGLCFWGIARLAVRGNYYEHLPTQQRLVKRLVHLDPVEVHRYLTLFEQNRIDEILAARIDRSSTLMCEAWNTKDNRVVCAQLVEYKGFQSSTLTPVKLIAKAG